VLNNIDASLRNVCIKIDVEGHERTVLESARPATLRQRVDAIFVEVHLYLFNDPYTELRQICELVTPVGEPQYLISTPTLYPGYQRLWRHMSGRYPTEHLSVNVLCDLVEHHHVPDLFVVAQRASRMGGRQLAASNHGRANPTGVKK
jgi:hypothetical protein